MDNQNTMSMHSDELKTLCLINAQQKIAAIRCVDRSFLGCVEQFSRGYAQALTDAKILSLDQRDKLYALVDQAVELRVRMQSGDNKNNHT